ncbi:uncharacterized protein TNCV_2618351 [Trichonephila clavipes]|nr:uncharacterized protein TNCV_2618351 [Trichonephila clavipes]
MDGKSRSNTVASPGSLDITLLDFFLWGYVKNIVYQSSISDTEERKSRIIVIIQITDPEMLHKTWLDISYRYDVLPGAS